MIQLFRINIFIVLLILISSCSSEDVNQTESTTLIATTPFLAGCNKAIETSFSHLTIYLMSIDESAKDIYCHKEEDDEDIYSRLFPISIFSGGKREIIECCMDLMVLCMLSNYKKDSEEDKLIGKYNPINSGKWDYETMFAKLIENIDRSITTEILNIYTKEDAIKGYWKS